MKEYYNIGSPEDIVISSSSFHTIDPSQGGYPKKFLNFFKDKEEEKEKTSTKANGRLVHSYIEEPEQFVVADFEAPSEMMAGLLDKCVINAINLTSNLGFVADVSIIISPNPSKPAEGVELYNAFENLAKLLRCSTENAIRAYRVANAIANAYKNKKESTIVSDIIKGESERKYIEFLFNSQNKIALPKEDKLKVEGAINSLTLHPRVSKLLGLAPVDDLNEETKLIVYREVPIFWEERVQILGTRGEEGDFTTLSCKALLDRLIIDHIAKEVIYIDLKTTSSSIYLFQDSFEYYRYYRQKAFYMRAIEQLFKQKFPEVNYSEYKLQVLIVPVETFGDFKTSIYWVSPQWIYKGKSEAAELMSRIAYHKINGFNESYEEITGGGYLKFKNPEVKSII